MEKKTKKHGLIGFFFFGLQNTGGNYATFKTAVGL